MSSLALGSSQQDIRMKMQNSSNTSEWQVSLFTMTNIRPATNVCCACQWDLFSAKMKLLLLIEQLTANML